MTNFKSNIIQEVFSNKVKSNLSKNSKVTFADGGKTDSDVYSPIEFLHKFMKIVSVQEGNDIDRDIQLMETWERVQIELSRLKSTKQFAPATIFEMYMMTDDKMMDVANKIGISKSTTFSCIKKIKKHLQNEIKNPFQNE
jgi:predicted DNA-binding protein YlxM (UPF0122 family)